MSFIVDYGLPLAGAAVVLLGYHLLVRSKAPKASLPVVEELPEVEDLVRMRSAGRSSLAAEAEDITQRINSLGARLPLMMPDDPRYAAHGDRNNRMSDDYFMREYRESIETDVQRALGRANARKLLDANDRIYLLHKAAARRAVEEIMRVMTRIAVKEREGEVEERLLIRDAAVLAYEMVEPTKFGQFVRQQYDEPETRPGKKKRKPPTVSAAAPKTKLSQLEGMLRRKEGVTIAQIATALDWQLHSVRGAISGSLKKKQGLTIASEKTEDGRHVYRIA